MPRVPQYDNQTVGLNGPSNTQYQTPNVPDVASNNLKNAGEALMSAGQGAGTIALDIMHEANNTRIMEGTKYAVDQATDLTMEARKLTGKNALERPDNKSLATEYTEKFDEATTKIVDSLSNDAQKKGFKERALGLRGQIYSQLIQHQFEQQKQYENDTQLGMIDSATKRGVMLWGTPGLLDQSQEAIKNVVDVMAKSKGWSPEEKAVKLSEAVSPLHVGAVQSMIRAGKAAEAEAYYNNNSAGMTLQAQVHAQNMIQPAVVEQAANDAADKIWEDIGPKTINDAVKTFDMEKSMRETFKGDKGRLDAGIAAIKQRAAAFNHQQTESNAAGVNSLYKNLDKGMSLRSLKKTDEWLSLPAEKRHAVEKEWLAWTDSKISNELSILQRGEKLALFRNADKYLTATDPTVLARMSRTQVEALRTEFGMEVTHDLLTKWDNLQKPGAIMEASIDQDAFNNMAEQMGLHPFQKSLSEEKKKQLGQLKYRVENLIEQEQQATKSKLSRARKDEIMREEIGHRVTIDPGMLSFEKQVSVAQMTPDQVKQVVIPNEEKSKIVEALQNAYKRNPNNPAYAPTQENMNRLYLLKQSRTAGMIPNGK